MTAQKPREIAFHILRDREKGEHFVEKLLEERLATNALSAQDRSLLQQLVYGVVRWKRTLEYLIARKAPGRTQKPGLRLILSLGLFQLFWLDRVPDHAAVDESVELAKRAGFGPQAGFVNAVLRGYVREAGETEQMLKALETQNPPLGLSHPDWLFERWQARFGRDNATALLSWNNTVPPTFARVNILKTDSEQLKATWDQEGVEYEVREWDWTPPEMIFHLRFHPPLHQLQSFREGKFYVQDPSTLLAVRELDPKPGEKILDYCAAPGGKTTLIAQAMANRGMIVACDSDANRVGMIRENCQRLGADIVRPAAINEPIIEAEAPYDRILVDAPCSNTGVMRRRVDLRWRIQPPEIQRLPRTQLEILTRAAALLVKGGRLVYSTCSLETDENEGVLAEFLSKKTEFTMLKQRTLAPFFDGVDGAFAGVLERKDL